VQSTLGRRRENSKLSQEERQEKKKAILAALTKASDDSHMRESSAEFSALEPDDYYTLSRDEIHALVNGDMEKLENWVSNMDRNHATRLLRWLIKERW
jgi:sarcosine oxidase gamma subunit